jgi:hypothetical protein
MRTTLSKTFLHNLTRPKKTASLTLDAQDAIIMKNRILLYGEVQ